MRRAIQLGWTWMARAGIAVLVWLLIAEAVEPHWTLAPASMLFPRPAPLQIPALGDTTLRLYADSRPHVGKIAGLQKGLVWVASGRELVEEGYGFGCPIVQLEGRSYNSRQAETEVLSSGGQTRLIKRYMVDTLDTPVRLLQRKYRPIPAQGIVSVTYDLQPQGVIDIHVDLTQIEGRWERVFLMNEQGASAFPYYRDARGKRYGPQELGIWEQGTREEACFESQEGRYSFCVQPGEGLAYFGREQYWQYNWRGAYRLSWAGIDVVIEGPRDHYEYRIVLRAP